VNDDAPLKESQASDRETLYFEFLADMGFTKHIGGMASTEELIEACYIDEGKYVLDVGCGVGSTPCCLARTYRCHVVGVDITGGMIDRANERAAKEGLQDLVEFRVADARDLPFHDAVFDVVMVESVIALVADKQKAVHELVRAAKPGGYVGLNESTWVKGPPQKTIDFFARALGSNLQILTADGWQELLVEAGLKDVTANAHSITYRSEASNRLKRMGWKEIGRIFYRFFAVALTNPVYKGFMKDALADPRGMMEYVGYGIYAGRKWLARCLPGERAG